MVCLPVFQKGKLSLKLRILLKSGACVGKINLLRNRKLRLGNCL